jgi:hypothetical protein
VIVPAKEDHDYRQKQIPAKLGVTLAQLGQGKKSGGSLAGTTNTWHAACIGQIREAIGMGTQTRGDVSIVLTAKEVDALKRAIRECTTNTGSSDVTSLKAIAAKLKTAEETPK